MKSTLCSPKYKIARLLINFWFFLRHHCFLRGTQLKNKKILICNSFKCKGKNNMICLEDGGKISHCKFYINGNNNKIIIRSNSNAFQTEFYIEDNDNVIEIGEGTSLCGKAHIACIEGTKVYIGNNCLVSSNIYFRTGDSHSVIDKNGTRLNHSRNVSIGDHVWICNSCIILKGAEIKNNSILAAGSILNKKIEKENVVIAGSPAKIVKENINWNEKRL